MIDCSAGVAEVLAGVAVSEDLAAAAEESLGECAEGYWVVALCEKIP